MTERPNPCCNLPDLQHGGTCHDCGGVEVPMHEAYSADRGEPICRPCGMVALRLVINGDQMNEDSI